MIIVKNFTFFLLNPCISAMGVIECHCCVYYRASLGRAKDLRRSQAAMSDQKAKFAELQKAIDEHKGEKGALMPVLQAAQGIFGCVPMDVQEIIADALGTTLSDVYGVATFYSQFSLQPKGKYVVGVCMGTACYVRGAQKVLDRVQKELSVEVGNTTADGLFTLQATRCLGACGLAPVMMVNDEVYGRLTEDEIPAILDKYKA